MRLRLAAGVLALLAWAAAPAAAAPPEAGTAPGGGGAPGHAQLLWGPPSPGAARVGTAQELLQALQAGVGDITLTGAPLAVLAKLARPPPAPAQGAGCHGVRHRAVAAPPRKYREVAASGASQGPWPSNPPPLSFASPPRPCYL